MAMIRERSSGSFEIRITNKKILGKPAYFSFEGDEASAREYAKRLEEQIARGVIPKSVIDRQKAQLIKTVAEGVKLYRSENALTLQDRSLLDIILRSLPKGFELKDVTFQWATRWVSEMKRVKNLAPATIRSRVGALARAFDWIAARGDMPTNPLRLLPRGYSKYSNEDIRQVTANKGVVKTSEGRDRRLEPGEEEKIREVLANGKLKGSDRVALSLPNREALQLMFDMALESAMRMREIYTLDWTQVDLEKRTIFLEKTKNGTKRQVPITSVLLALLTRHKKEKGSVGRLFPWWNGDPSEAALARTTTVLSRQWARIFDAAGCGDLHFHDLRHEATSRLFERTSLTDLQISKITGHKSMAMLQRYANLRASNLAEHLW